MKRKFLTDLGITDTDVIKQIIDYHQGVVTDLKEDITTAQTDLKTAQTTIKTLESAKPADSNGDGTDWKAEYDKIKGDFDVYKSSVETEKINSTKKAALYSALKTEGASEKVIELLESKFDIEKIELDGDKIKSWTDLVKPVKEQFAEFFGKVTVEGVNPANPPKSEGNPYAGKTVYELMVEANSNPGKTNEILAQIETMNKNNSQTGGNNNG